MDIIEMTRKLGVEIQQQEVFKNNLWICKFLWW